MYAKLCTKRIRQSQAILRALSVWQDAFVHASGNLERITEATNMTASRGIDPPSKMDQHVIARRENRSCAPVLLSDPRNATPIRLSFSNYQIPGCPRPRGRLFSQERAAYVRHSLPRLFVLSEGRHSCKSTKVTGREKKGDSLIERAECLIRGANRFVDRARSADANCSRARRVPTRARIYVTITSRT